MAIRRPPTTFSDTISTADIADDAITGGKLANDIAISTTGNIATTGSGALTVAGNTTLSGTNNLGSNPTITLGSNATLPVGTVVSVTTMRGSSGTTWDLDNAMSQTPVTNSTKYATTNFFKVTPSKSGNTLVIVGIFPIGFSNSSGGDAGVSLQ